MYFESYLKQRTQPVGREQGDGSTRVPEAGVTPLRPQPQSSSTAYVPLQRPHSKTTMQFGQSKYPPPPSSFIPNRGSTIVQTNPYSHSMVSPHTQPRPSSTAITHISPLKHQGRASEGVNTFSGPKGKEHKRCDSLVESNTSDHHNATDVTEFPQQDLNASITQKGGLRKTYKDYLLEEGIKDSHIKSFNDRSMTNMSSSQTRAEQYQLKTIDQILQRKEN